MPVRRQELAPKDEVGFRMSYRTLDAAEIVRTLQALEQRIAQRFPDAGLASVCRDLIAIGERTQRNADAIAAINWPLRVIVYLAVVAGLAALGFVALTLKVRVGSAEVFTFFQGVDAAMNITVLVGAALLFATTVDVRNKRRRALRELHVFRSIAHVIDMHQLTMDPISILAGGPPTASSPRRSMNNFELARYLDYCSEMLSLTSKLAALYAQVLPDAVVIDAVNEIENLSANLSRKIWQKISIVESFALAPSVVPTKSPP
jgi:hypothetical protein